MIKAGENLKSRRLSLILKSEYTKTIILTIILFVGIFAFWFGLRLVFQTEFPLLAVASGSMEPLLYKGDLIIVQGGLNFNELNAAPKDAEPPGEVIVYYDPRFARNPIFLPVAGPETHLIVHRAVEKYQLENGTWVFETKGDANPSKDGWGPIGQDFVVGRVVGKVPWLGNIPLFMHENPILAALFIGFLFVVLIIVDFIFPEKEKRKLEVERKSC